MSSFWSKCTLFKQVLNWVSWLNTLSLLFDLSGTLLGRVMSGKMSHRGGMISHIFWGIKNCLLFKSYDITTLNKTGSSTTLINIQTVLFLSCLVLKLDFIKPKAVTIFLQSDILQQMLYIPWKQCPQLIHLYISISAYEVFATYRIPHKCLMDIWTVSLPNLYLTHITKGIFYLVL